MSDIAKKPDQPTTKENKIVFDQSFLDTFKSIKTLIDKASKKLEAIDIAKFPDYGTCGCTYKLRFISPENISTYISGLTKSFQLGLISQKNIDDINMFTVKMVTDFFKQNDYAPIDDYTTNVKPGYVNAKAKTLNDILFIIEDELSKHSIYSKWECEERSKYVKEDYKIFKELYFPATITKIVDSLPEILRNSGLLTFGWESDAIMINTIQSFILFACTLNLFTLTGMIKYVYPRSSFNVVNAKASTREDTFIECCMLRTNDLLIQNKLPFDCNMKNIVLQDMHPEFKDTMSALVFLITDTRSPIRTLLAKFAPDDCLFTAKDLAHGTGYGDIISKMFINQVNDTSNIHEPGEIIDNYDKVGFHSDVNWLDKIAYGNNYLDHNYRRDAMGNQHVHPIRNTLDMIYRIYGGTNLETNGDLSRNICDVSNIMSSIINKYPNGGIPNWDLVKDILVVFGEILTRNMLKLYYNNNEVITYDDDMLDTMVPGYLYNESYVMEADAPTVSNDNGTPAPGGIVNKIKRVVSNVPELIAKFGEWVAKNLATFYTKFNQDHARELDWIKKNQKTNEAIASAISKGLFAPNLGNYPDFKIPAKALKADNVGSIVDKWLNSNAPIDPKVIKKELYPGDDNIKNEIVNKANEAEEIAALTNYILYSQTKPGPVYTGPLTEVIWENLLKDLSATGNLIENETKAMSDSLKRAVSTLSGKVREEEIKKNANQPKPTNGQNPEVTVTNNGNTGETSRAKQIFDVVQSVSKTYYVTLLNILRNRFYATNYKVYREIVISFNRDFNVNDKEVAPTTEPEAQNNSQGG